MKYRNTNQTFMDSMKNQPMNVQLNSLATMRALTLFLSVVSMEFDLFLQIARYVSHCTMATQRIPFVKNPLYLDVPKSHHQNKIMQLQPKWSASQTPILFRKYLRKEQHPSAGRLEAKLYVKPKIPGNTLTERKAMMKGC